MTTLVSSEDFVEFCRGKRVFGFAHKLGKGWEVDWAGTPHVDPYQDDFDRWELSQPPMFSTEYGFWKLWRQKKTEDKISGQPELKL